MKKRDRAELQLNLFTDADFGMSAETIPSTNTAQKQPSCSIRYSDGTTNIHTADAPIGRMGASIEHAGVTIHKARTQVRETASSVGHAEALAGNGETSVGHPKGTLGFESVQTAHDDFTDLFRRLSKSNFRSGFHLKFRDKQYIDQKGLATIRQHAADFVSKRLAPAIIPNDGKQTPMRGHPVFIAQHATACCCRGCFSKWHHIPAGRALTSKEQEYAVNVLMTWIEKEYKNI